MAGSIQRNNTVVTLHYEPAPRLALEGSTLSHPPTFTSVLWLSSSHTTSLCFSSSVLLYFRNTQPNYSTSTSNVCKHSICSRKTCPVPPPCVWELRSNSSSILATYTTDPFFSSLPFNPKLFCILLLDPSLSQASRRWAWLCNFSISRIKLFTSR